MWGVKFPYLLSLFVCACFLCVWGFMQSGVLPAEREEEEEEWRGGQMVNGLEQRAQQALLKR